MAEYITIKGYTLQNRTSDPLNDTGIWASGGALNTARTGLQSGSEGASGAIVGGGYNASSSSSRVQSEQYNGTSWTETNNLNTSRMFGNGTGISTAAIIFGGDAGSISADTETWNGTSWTEVNNLNTARNQNAGVGTVPSALCIGGGNPNAVTNVESWNGTSWSETSTDLNTAKKYVVGTGTVTACIALGRPATTEQFNGSSWTEIAETNVEHGSGNGSGIVTDALVWGGDNPGYKGDTEAWNGSAWTEVNNLATARAYLGGSGNSPSGGNNSLAFGGSTPSQTTATEEFIVGGVSDSIIDIGKVFYRSDTGDMKVTLNVFGTGAWSSGGNINTARTHMGQGGTQTAAIVFGGNTPPSSQLTELYNGSAWTEVNEMTETARDQMYSFGTQTSAISAAGVTGSNGAKSKLVEDWDGTSWTAGTDNNTARQAGASAGATGTSGIMYAGVDASGPGNTPSAATESWNGTAWTELNNLNTAGAYVAGGGTQTSALCSFGGGRPDKNESWNGTSWSEIAEQNTFRDQSGGAASGNTSGLIYGGEAPPYTAKTESWNGTAWTEVADLATATGIGSGGSGGQTGSNAIALAVGGQAGPGARVATTQHWNVPSAVTNATITD